jgi:hypothetical protein
VIDQIHNGMVTCETSTFPIACHTLPTVDTKSIEVILMIGADGAGLVKKACSLQTRTHIVVVIAICVCIDEA